MKIIKQHWKFLLFVCLAGIVGGFFVSLSFPNMLTETQLTSILDKVGSFTVLQIIAVVQSTIYAVIFGVLGLVLSHKTNLWKPISFQQSTVVKVALTSIVAGTLIAVLDSQVFAAMIPQIAPEIQKPPSFPYIAAAFTYGAVVEEVMLRLFLMSLVAFGIYKIFYRKEETVPVMVFSVANILAALIFALAHLPATTTFWGELTVPIVIRCMLFNGGMGLFFGFFYRKYGIHYAMLAHFGAHVGMISVGALTYWMLQAG